VKPVKLRQALVLGVVVALFLALAVVAGCGSDEQAKTDLGEALDKVEASIAKFQQMGEDTTVADIKAARDEVASLWQSVVAAAEKVKNADVTAAKNAWTEVDKAVSSLTDDLTISQVTGVIMTPVQGLIKVESDLRALVIEVE
jgi:outer membrane murein-binding lipoprotein Lpp